MDKSDKQRRIKEWKLAWLTEAKARLPLPDGEMSAVFSVLGMHFVTISCDRTRRVTESWLAARGHSIERVGSWLDETGGYCDCEVLGNSRDAWMEATGQ